MAYEVVTIHDLLPMEIDIDLCDDYDESLQIAYCGPKKLTIAGLKEFAWLLGTEVELRTYGHYIIGVVRVRDDEERLEGVKRLFNALAGYCPVSAYDLWFKEVE